MSYVQAAVYDAVTKLEGRYEPYHDFTFAVVPNASVQAAVAAATRTTLDTYLPDQQPTVDGEYGAYIATLTGDVADGEALGEAAAHDMTALRTGDGLNAATPSYGDRTDPARSVAAATRSGGRRRGSRRCARSCSSERRTSGSGPRPR